MEHFIHKATECDIADAAIVCLKADVKRLEAERAAFVEESIALRDERERLQDALEVAISTLKGCGALPIVIDGINAIVEGKKP